MKNKTIKKILTILIIALFIILITQTSFATIKPEDLTGRNPGISDFGTDFTDKLVDMIRTIGIFIAVGVMMLLGIKYMTGSLEEKATYKKSMVPYIIGCILLFGASTIAPQVVEVFKDIEDPNELGNEVLGLIQGIGTFISIGTIMMLGIKYMMGSAEEKASYKKSMLPFLIGSVLLFGAVNITSAIYNGIGMDDPWSSSQAKSAAASFYNEHKGTEGAGEAIRKEYNSGEWIEKKDNAKTEEERKYWLNYGNELYNLAKDTYL